MAGFASFIGGMGQSAEKYGEHQRELMLREWGIRQKTLVDLIGAAIPHATTPDRISELIKLQSEVANSRPGEPHEKTAKTLQNIQEHLSINPLVSQALAPRKEEPPPGPGQAGQLGKMSGLISGQAPAAQPSTSPVQPSQQRGFSSIAQNPTSEFEHLVPPDVAAPPMQAQPNPQSQSQIGPVQAPASKPVSAEPPIMAAHRQAMQAGWMPTPVQLGAQPFLSNEAELSRLRGVKDYQLSLGPEYLKALQSPEAEAYMKFLIGKGLPPVSAMQETAAAFGIPQSGMSAGYRAAAVQYKRVDADPMTPEQKAQHGIPPDGQGLWMAGFNYMGDPTGQASPGYSAPGTFMDQDYNQFVASRRTPGYVQGPGGAQATARSPMIRGVDTATGKDVVTNLQRLTHGALARSTGMTAYPAMPQVTSTTTYTAGEEPKTSDTTTQRFAPGTPPNILAVSPPRPKAEDDALFQRKYDDWVSGAAVPTGPSLTALQNWAQKKGLESPVALSAKGTSDMRAVEGVLSQISRIRELMRQNKMDKDNTLDYYKDYLTYRRGGRSTPKEELWTLLQFEALRSASAGMQGMPSRAMPLINRALEHTPDPSANTNLTNIKLPDTPAKMYGQLGSAEKLLQDERQAILNNERKTGIIAPVGSGRGGFKYTAVGPNGERIGSNDGVSWQPIK